MTAADSSLPPAKKRKLATKRRGDLERIQRLEDLLLEAVSGGTSLNPLVDLLDATKDAGDPHVLFKCIYALYRVFASITDTGMLVPTPDAGAKIVRAWIWERFNVFTDMLVGLMNDSEKSLRVSVVATPSPWKSTKFLSSPRYKFSSPSSGTCRLLCHPARMPRGLLHRPTFLSTSLTSTKSFLGCSNALRAHVHRVIDPKPNCLTLKSLKPSHQRGLTPTTILDGSSYETLRMPPYTLPLRCRSYMLLEPSFRNTRWILIPTSRKIS